MSDPISAAAARAFGGALGTAGTGGVGGAGGVGDTARKYIIDVGKGEGPSFKDTLARALDGVSEAQDRADDYVAKYLRGEPVEIHQVMAASEEAGIALQMLIELRNKFTDAYKTVINMQS